MHAPTKFPTDQQRHVYDASTIGRQKHLPQSLGLVACNTSFKIKYYADGFKLTGGLTRIPCERDINIIKVRLNTICGLSHMFGRLANDRDVIHINPSYGTIPHHWGRQPISHFGDGCWHSSTNNMCNSFICQKKRPTPTHSKPSEHWKEYLFRWWPKESLCFIGKYLGSFPSSFLPLPPSHRTVNSKPRCKWLMKEVIETICNIRFNPKCTRFAFHISVKLNV